MKTRFLLMFAGILGCQSSLAELVKVGPKQSEHGATSVDGISVVIKERKLVRLIGFYVTIDQKLFDRVTAALSVSGADGSEIAIADLDTTSGEPDCKISCELAPSVFTHSFLAITCHSNGSRTTYQLPLSRFRQGGAPKDSK